jgi:hypothetical protein
VERWLQNTGQRLHGNEPIPTLSVLTPTAVATPVDEPSEQSVEPSWNPSRAAAG